MKPSGGWMPLAVLLCSWRMVASGFFNSNHSSSRKPTDADQQKWEDEARKECLRSVVTGDSKGRFGNSFMVWASALGFARRLTQALPNDEKRVVALPGDLYTQLTSVLDGVQGTSLRDLMLERTVQRPDGMNVSCILVVTNPEEVSSKRTPRGHFFFYSPQLAAGNKTLVLKYYADFAPAIAPIAEDLRKELTFKEYFAEKARERIRSLVNQTRVMYRNEDDQVLVVGMHVRRTDYKRHLSFMYKMRLLDEGFFVRALRWMVWTLRTELSNTTCTFHGLRREGSPPIIVGTPPRQELPATPLIVVAIISDDMLWVRKKLIPALNDYIRGEEVKAVEVFAVGSDEPYVDLALLAQCNHTVIGYGTFGTAGALLSGGRTVSYRMQKGAIHEELARFLPNWVLMD